MRRRPHPLRFYKNADDFVERATPVDRLSLALHEQDPATQRGMLAEVVQAVLEADDSERQVRLLAWHFLSAGVAEPGAAGDASGMGEEPGPATANGPYPSSLAEVRIVVDVLRRIVDEDVTLADDLWAAVGYMESAEGKARDPITKKSLSSLRGSLSARLESASRKGAKS